METSKRNVIKSYNSQNAYKDLELATINLDEDIFNLKCNVELRTSQFQRLVTESIRNSSKNSPGLTGSQNPKESIFSSNNYGLSTLTEVKAEQKPKNSRGSTGGPKVKTKKPYCNLI